LTVSYAIAVFYYIIIDIGPYPEIHSHA